MVPRVKPSLAFGSGVGFRIFLQEVERSGFFGRKLGHLGNFLDRSRSGHFRQQLNAAVVLEARSSGNETAPDDVFFQAAEVIHLAGNRRFRKDAGGLLEAGGGDERVRRERRLGDTKEQRAARCGAATVSDHAIVLFAEAELVHLLLEEERGVADVFDLDPAHHLPGDGLDVLVVDVDALEAVNLLNGVHQVRLGEFLTEHGQQVVQVQRAIDQGLTGPDMVAFLNVDVHAARNRVFLRGLAVFAFYVDLAHALGNFAVAHHAIHFADDRRILRLARLEEFHDARETSGDVLGLGRLSRDFREHVAGLHLVAVPDHQVSAGRHEVLLADLARGITDKNRGLMLFIARRQCNDVLREAGDFVHLLFDRQAGPQVVKLHGAGGFGKDREGERIPFSQDLPVRNALAFGDAEARAVNDVVALLFAALLVDDGDQARTVHGDGDTAAALNILEVHELDDAVVARFQCGTLGNARGGSTDVERTHRKLSAGLADGLRGDNADCFAELDHPAGSQVASVAQCANTATGFAGEHRANAHALDTRGLHGVRKFLGDFLVHVDNHVALEVLDLVERHAADDAVAQRLDFDASFDDGLDVNAVAGAAIAFVDDHVLRHVHEAAGQVAGIGRLERRIRQTLPRAVRGDEVLQHVEAFAEVRGDRRFHNLAGRLGHQSAHTGELANLLFRSASAGVRHDVDRVDVALFVLVLERLEHLVRNAFGDVAPERDDLVVALAVRDGAIQVLLLHLDDFAFGGVHEFRLVARDDHVVDADGDARFRGVRETKLLHVIEQNDRTLEPITQVGVINQLLHTFLLQQTVDVGEILRQVRVENDPSDSGLNKLTFHPHRNGVRYVLIVVRGGEVDYFTAVTQTNRSEQLDFAGFEREHNFLGRAENAALALSAGLGLGQVVNAEHHVLRRHRQGQAVRRRQNVARAEHQHRRFHLRFRRQRDVHGHLVTVKVRVERGADERMDANRLAFHQHRLEGLNAEAVKRGSAVQQYGMFANDVFENIPDYRLLLLDHFLGLLDGRAMTLRFELVIDERLEQLERHLLRQTALIELQLRADHDNRAAGVVNALAEQVLTEAALLALERIGQGLERAVVGSTQHTATAAVVE